MTDQRKQYRLYGSLTDAEIDDIAREWADTQPRMRLSRWLNGWLADHDFTRDHTLDDESNQNQFEAVLNRFYAALDRMRRSS